MPVSYRFIPLRAAEVGVSENKVAPFENRDAGVGPSNGNCVRLKRQSRLERKDTRKPPTAYQLVNDSSAVQITFVPAERQFHNPVCYPTMGNIKGGDAAVCVKVVVVWQKGMVLSQSKHFCSLVNALGPCVGRSKHVAV